MMVIIGRINRIRSKKIKYVNVGSRGSACEASE
jgi:hypothetical protein